MNEVLNEKNWIMAMHEELNQFTRNNIFNLAPKPHDLSIVGMKWPSKINLMNKVI